MIKLEDYFDGKNKCKFKHGDEFRVGNTTVILLETSECTFRTITKDNWIMGNAHHILNKAVSIDDIIIMLPTMLREYTPIPVDQTINSLYKGSILTNLHTCDIYMLTKYDGKFVLTNLSTGVAIDSLWYAESVKDQCCLSKKEWLDWHPFDNTIDQWLIADGPVQIG